MAIGEKSAGGRGGMGESIALPDSQGVSRDKEGLVWLAQCHSWVELKPARSVDGSLLVRRL